MKWKRVKQRGGREKHQRSKKQKEEQRIMSQKEAMTLDGVEGKERQKEIYRETTVRMIKGTTGRVLRKESRSETEGQQQV